MTQSQLLKGFACVLVGVALTFASAAVLGHVRWEPSPKPGPVEPVNPKPEPKPNPKPEPNPDWFGLHRNEAEHRLIVASIPKVSRVAPQLMIRDANDKRPILLYKAWTTLFRTDPPYPAQQVGDCVSFGHAHANDLLQCIEWCLANPHKEPTPADIQETSTEALYAMAREAGNMLGGQDGCFGSAAVKAMTTAGVASRRMLGAEGTYSGRRARAWGRSGAPASVKEIAAKYKLGSAARVTTWDELVAALHNGNPVTICTGRGFTTTRDRQGFCTLRGSWGHCMFIAGARFDREGACIVQSWGPEQPSGPTDLDQPSYSFWADRSAIEAILAEGDSWAISKSPYFGGAARDKHRVMPKAWRSGNKAA